MSLAELEKEARRLCPGGVVTRGERGLECLSNDEPGVGRRLESVKNEIARRCKTAPLREAERALCPGTGRIGG